MMQDRQSSRASCYIEFRIHDPQRYMLLERFFNPLRDYTQQIEPAIAKVDDMTTLEHRPAPGRMNAFAETQETQRVEAREETQNRRHFAKPEEWLLAFRPQDLEALQMPPHRDAIIAMREWQGMSRRERRKAIKAHENKRELRGLADFTDMLKYWQEVEYELVSLKQTDPDKARISYAPFDYPYKGKVALEELLMFFGFLSILKDSC